MALPHKLARVLPTDGADLETLQARWRELLIKYRITADDCSEWHNLLYVHDSLTESAIEILPMFSASLAAVPDDLYGAAAVAAMRHRLQLALEGDDEAVI